MAIHCVDCGMVSWVDDHCRCAACGAKVNRDRLMKNLLEAAEEMYEYCSNWTLLKSDDTWSIAIAAAKAELERMKK